MINTINSEKSDKRLLSASVAQKINNMIVQQNLKPGTKLPSESQLIEWYQVSRPTIREAMKILKAQNVVIIRQGDGTYISDYTGMGEDPLGLRYVEPDILAEGIFEVRLLIEPQIAMLAATRATEENLEELRKITIQMQQTEYKEAARLDLDIAFHTLIAKSTQNTVFDHLIPVIYDTIQKGVVILQQSEESHRHAQHMHAEIYRAIANHDVCRAKSAVSAHIYSALDEIRLLAGSQKEEIV